MTSPVRASPRAARRAGAARVAAERPGRDADGQAEGEQQPEREHHDAQTRHPDKQSRDAGPAAALGAHRRLALDRQEAERLPQVLRVTGAPCLGDALLELLHGQSSVEQMAAQQPDRVLALAI